MATTVRSLVGDQRVLALLDERPKTSAEITHLLRREVWQSWAEQEGIELEWDPEGMPTQGLVRLLAWSSAASRGLATLNREQVYARLLKLERQGLACRIQLPAPQADPLAARSGRLRLLARRPRALAELEHLFQGVDDRLWACPFRQVASGAQGQDLCFDDLGCEAGKERTTTFAASAARHSSGSATSPETSSSNLSAR